ncbi:MAG TPA: BrnT family toxin [Thermoanaerobaculia bacterium]|jgi:hypothetical protein
MRIEGIIWLRAVVDKLGYKHNVETFEVEEALSNRPKIRRIEKGQRKGEDVYMALGQTNAGKYLTVLFILKPDDQALILSARNMAPKERKRYGQK